MSNMRSDSRSPVCRKPAGGVRSAALAAADDIETLLFSDDGSRCEVFRLRDGAQVMECHLVEDRSSFAETLTLDDGAPLVRHTLTLAADRNSAAAWLEGRFLDDVRRAGVVAAVTLEDGRTLLAGASRRFALEQPLRMKSLAADSGKHHADAPALVLVLESLDTSFAAALDNR